MILRVVDSTGGTIDELAATLAGSLEDALAARYGTGYVPKSDESGEVAGLIADYRDLGIAVVHTCSTRGCDGRWCRPSRTTRPGSSRAGTGYRPTRSHPCRRGVAAEPLGQPHRDDRNQGQRRRDDVDDRCLVGPEQVSEDPDRQGLHGRARGERRHHDFVEAEREGQDRARDERAAHHREGHVAECLPWRGAEIGRRVLEAGSQPAQPRLRVVEDDDDAERGMADDHRCQAQRDAECRGEGRVQCDTGDDARQCDRQHDKETDDFAAEEPVPLHGEGGHGAETNAIAVAPRPTVTELASDFHIPSLCHAATHHCVVKPLGGKAKVRDELNALTSTRAKGT